MQRQTLDGIRGDPGPEDPGPGEHAASAQGSRAFGTAARMHL